MVEDRWVGGEPRDREVVDVMLKSSSVEEVASNIVEPETLTEIVKKFGCLHLFVSVKRWLRMICFSARFPLFLFD